MTRLSLRARLAAGSASLIVFATAALGWATVANVRASVDERAREEVETMAGSLRPTTEFQIGRVEEGKRPLGYRALAKLELSNPTGLTAQLVLDNTVIPLPVLSPLPEGLDLPDDLASWADGTVRLVGSDDGDQWVSVREVKNGALLIVVLSARFGDGLVAQVVRTTVWVGAVVVAVAALAAWWLVRRSLRPLARLASVADAVAAGDLDRRVSPVDRGSAATEVDRVSVAVNAMVDSLARAVEVEEALRVRAERFSADVSHELRTPITAVLGYAQLGASSGPFSDDRQAQMWAAVEREATRLRDLTEQLLDLQRLADADAPVPAAERFDAVEVVRSVVADSMVISAAHPISMSGASSVVVELPRDPLVQIVANLLANVRAHTPPGTTAEVNLTRAGNGDDAELVIEVRDAGPGIPAEHHGAVFDRLVRVPGTAGPGSGLGLAIVAALVERVGGQVRLAGGDGTTVTVALPATVAIEH